MTRGKDALNLLCGEQLGEGYHRSVFDCRLNPNWVVKVEKNPHYRTFHNVLEYTFWMDNRDYDDVAKWLAPCEFLSPSGLILIQRKARPVYELPNMLPAFMRDVKVQNFGIIDEQLVMTDYAFINPSWSVELKPVEKVDII